MNCKHYSNPGWCSNKKMVSPVCRWGEWPECKGFEELRPAPSERGDEGRKEERA